jgi:hypothetical protein
MVLSLIMLSSKEYGHVPTSFVPTNYQSYQLMTMVLYQLINVVLFKLSNNEQSQTTYLNRDKAINTSITPASSSTVGASSVWIKEGGGGTQLRSSHPPMPTWASPAHRPLPTPLQTRPRSKSKNVEAPRVDLRVVMCLEQRAMVGILNMACSGAEGSIACTGSEGGGVSSCMVGTGAPACVCSCVGAYKTRQGVHMSK